MTEKIISALLVVASVIHLPPLSGVLGSRRLAALYGLQFEEPNLLILMQHRAVLLGLLGALMIVAAFRRELQPVALVAGLIGAGSFVVLAQVIGAHNALIGRIVVADIAAVACLVIAAGLWAARRLSA